MTLHIIQHSDGSRQVISTDGDPLEAQGEGWTVIASDVPVPPEDGSWDGSAWIIDTASQAEKAAFAEVTDKRKLRLALKAARSRIAGLETAVLDLQNRVNTLEGS